SVFDTALIEANQSLYVIRIPTTTGRTYCPLLGYQACRKSFMPAPLMTMVNAVNASLASRLAFLTAQKTNIANAAAKISDLSNFTVLLPTVISARRSLDLFTAFRPAYALT